MTSHQLSGRRLWQPSATPSTLLVRLAVRAQLSGLSSCVGAAGQSCCLTHSLVMGYTAHVLVGYRARQICVW
jgi:hypothetical protein